MGGAEITIIVVILLAIGIAVAVYLSNLKSRKQQTEYLLTNSVNKDFEKHYGDYIRANMKEQKWAVPVKLPYGKGDAVVTKGARTYSFSEIKSYKTVLYDGVSTSTKGSYNTHESILTGKTYGVLSATTTSKKIATSLIVRIDLTEDRTVRIVVFDKKHLDESDKQFGTYLSDAKRIGEFIEMMMNEAAKQAALEKAAERARHQAEKAAQKAAEKEQKEAEKARLAEERAAQKAAEKAAKPKTERKPRAKKTAEPAEAPAPASPANDAVSSAEAIKKFKELLDMGAITEEEYEQKKKELLGLN